jgi:hypothetical protein
LDPCYNYSVGPALYAYLQALSRLEYRSRQTVPFVGTGVEYRCQSVKTKFYDKRSETTSLHPQDPAAWAPPGTLRHESTLRNTRDVRRALRSLTVPTFGSLEPESVLDILWRDLRHLGILDCTFATRDLALETLCDRYGPNRGLRLYGALCAFQDRQKNRLASETRTQRHAVTRTLAYLRKAGLAPALAEAVPLPATDAHLAPRLRAVPGRSYPARERIHLLS